jgi:hypothetical protein
MLRVSRPDIPGCRQLRAIPPSSETLDELHAGRQLLQTQGHGRLLVGKQGCLGSNHIQIGIQSQPVPVSGKVEEALRVRHSQVLFAQFL